MKVENKCFTAEFGKNKRSDAILKSETLKSKTTSQYDFFPCSKNNCRWRLTIENILK